MVHDILVTYVAGNYAVLTSFPLIPGRYGEMVSLPGQGFQKSEFRWKYLVLIELIVKNFPVHTPHTAIH
jgi:hypothetical protein